MVTVRGLAIVLVLATGLAGCNEPSDRDVPPVWKDPYRIVEPGQCLAQADCTWSESGGRWSLYLANLTTSGDPNGLAALTLGGDLASIVLRNLTITSDRIGIMVACASCSVDARGITIRNPGAGPGGAGFLFEHGVGSLVLSDASVAGFVRTINGQAERTIALRNVTAVGGSPAISLSSPGPLILEQVSVQAAETGLVFATMTELSVRQSRFTGNGIGIVPRQVHYPAPSVLVQGTTFEGNHVGAVLVANATLVDDSVFVGNGNATGGGALAFYDVPGGSTHTVRNSSFERNTWAAYTAPGEVMQVDAESNYWGAPTGPSVRSSTGAGFGAPAPAIGGAGDPVAEGVGFVPWLTAAPGHTPHILISDTPVSRLPWSS